MKISREWLGDYVDLTDLGDGEIASRLTSIGHAVESIENHHGDAVFDVEFTSNRIDAMSHLGVARELGAALGRELLTTTYETASASNARPTSVSISIDSPSMCDRYTALEIRDVTVRPSSSRIRQRLEAVGLRPINNIVDITNYVMLAVGHPLHAFDLDRLHGPAISVRAGRDGEFLRTLDGEKRKIDSDTVLICDSERPVALGGIIGGEESEITGSTRNVLLECAHFDPATIRRTARRLGIKTDASYRFERGVDPNDTVAAIEQAAGLIVSEAGGMAMAPLDVVARESLPRTVGLRQSTLSLISANSVGIGYALELFLRLGMQARATDDGIEVVVPTYRGDIVEEMDLIEEVLRFFGFENVPSAMPRVPTGDVRIEPMHRAGELVRDVLVGCGLNEVITYSFISESWNRLFSDHEPIRIENALTENVASMRLSLLPGLLEVVAFNRSYGTRDGALFEVGRIYQSHEGRFLERATAAIVLFGSALRGADDGKRPFDYFDLKGIVERLLGRFHVEVEFFPTGRDWLQQGRAGIARSGESPIAVLGVLEPSVAQKFEIKGDVVVAEVDLETVTECAREWTMEDVSRFPGIPMVLGLLHGRDVSYRRLETAIRQMDIPHLREFGLRDRYVPEGADEIKTTLGMWYQADDRSLTQEEVVELHHRLSSRLAEILPVQIVGQS